MFRHPVIRRLANVRNNIGINIHTEHVIEKTKQLVHETSRKQRSPNPVFLEARLTSMNLVRGPRFGPWFLRCVSLLTSTQTHEYVHICISVYVCVYVCVYTRMFLCGYVCMYVMLSYDML